MSLDVGLYRLNGARIETPTRAVGVTFSYNRHGAASLVAFFPCDFRRAWDLRNATNQAEVIVMDGANIIWRGTVEDRSVTADGFGVTAFGRQRVLSMPLYTGLWSVSTSQGWRRITQTDAAALTDLVTENFVTDNNNRLYIAAKKSASYADDAFGELSFAIPHGGERDITTFKANYELLFPSNWKLQLIRMDDDYSNRTVVSTVTANGSTQTGTISQTFTGQPRIGIRMLNDTGSASTPSGEDGVNHAILTDIRVTSSATPVLSSDIVAALATYADSINSGYIIGQRVSVTSQDLMDEDYEDERPDSILDYLALREDCDWGVDEHGSFYFYQTGSEGDTYQIDAEVLELQESVSGLVNAAYGIYRDTSGRTLRTATATDSQSVDIYGLKRVDAVTAKTSSATEAAVWRDAKLDSAGDYVIRAAVSFSRISDRTGFNVPLYALRPGDTLRIRNLPITLAPDVDKLREFVVEFVEYNVDTDTIRVEPIVPIPTIVTLLSTGINQQASIEPGTDPAWFAQF